MLTALVCTKDRPELLDACLRSLAAALPEGGELLVVATGDPSVEELVAGSGVDARFLHDPVGGKSRQLNLGLATAAHDVVVLTDDDCRVAPDWLTAMAAPFDDPAVGAAFGAVVGLSGLADAPLVPPSPGPAPEVTWAYANGAAMAVRRSAVLEVGGFDERLGPGAPVHGEEHDIVLRLQEAGWDVRIADAPVVEHLEWRDEAQTRDNLLVYSEGAGAFIGAALRRAPRRWLRMGLRRARYQLALWQHREAVGWRFGPATSWAFLRGVAHGLRLSPRRFVAYPPAVERMDPARSLRGRMRRRVDDVLIERGDQAAARRSPLQGHVLRIDHPPTARLVPRYGHGGPAHPRLDALLAAGVDGYRARFEELAELMDDLARIPRDGVDSTAPCWRNQWLIGLDTATLYGFTRRRRPRRYVEVGSGQSTKVVARARADGGLDTTIVSIDPFPRAEVDEICDVIHRAPLETVDLDAAFGDVQAGDVVFFDGSHRVLPNSDCVAFFLDVLPSLPDGVLVGIHDIWLPEDYPPEFLGLWWSEQYALATYLLAEAPWLEVVLPCFYASGRPDVSEPLAPLWRRSELDGVNPRGSAFWLQIRR